MTQTHPDDLIPGPELTEVILGFASSTLHYLGYGEGSELNKPLALYNIQIIDLLKKKTALNLSQEESALFEDVLKDLKDKFNALEST